MIQRHTNQADILNFTKEQIEKLFEIHDSCYAIQKNCGFSEFLLKKRAKQLNLDISAKRSKIFGSFSTEQVLEKCLELSTINEVALFYKISNEAVRERITAAPLEIKEKIQTRFRMNNRLHKVDEKFFDQELCEKTAYVAGFIAADGCIGTTANKNGGTTYRLTIGLSDKDEVFLRGLGTIMGSSRYHYVSEKNMVYLTIQSTIFCSYLMKNFELTPRKSYTVYIPKYVADSDMAIHYLRGLMDGDGCVGYHKNKYGDKRFYMNIVSCSKIMAYQIKEIFSRLLGEEIGVIRSRTLPSGHEFYIFIVEKINQLIKVRDLLYKDATIYLPRKFEKFTDPDLKYKNLTPIVATNLESGLKFYYQTIDEAVAAGFNRVQIFACLRGTVRELRGHTLAYDLPTNLSTIPVAVQANAPETP